MRRTAGRRMLTPAALFDDRAGVPPATLLVVDDDPSLRKILIGLGQQYGFIIRFADDGEEVVEIAEAGGIDLVILDFSLSGLAGFDVCWRLRAAGVTVPIMMISADSDPAGIMVALEIGADDYITRPFEPRELAARINARLRHRPNPSPVPLSFPGLIIDVARHEVHRDGRPVTLTPTEFDLLVLFATSPGRVISRSEMIERVWGNGIVNPRSVDAHIYRLRAKLEPGSSHPIYIHAAPGSGYRLERRRLEERLAGAPEPPPA